MGVRGRAAIPTGEAALRSLSLSPWAPHGEAACTAGSPQETLGKAVAGRHQVTREAKGEQALLSLFLLQLPRDLTECPNDIKQSRGGCGGSLSLFIPAGAVLP